MASSDAKARADLLDVATVDDATEAAEFDAAAGDHWEPFVPDVISGCCAAVVLRVSLSGGTWYECRGCGRVVG